MTESTLHFVFVLFSKTSCRDPQQEDRQSHFRTDACRSCQTKVQRVFPTGVRSTSFLTVLSYTFRKERR